MRNRNPFGTAVNYSNLFSTLSAKIEKPPREDLYCGGFVNCCGINIIYGFPGSSTSGMGQRGEMYEKDVEEQLAKHTKGSTGYGLTLVALNEDQIPLWHDYLIKAGYRVLVNKFYHKGHGNKITLYGFVQHSEEPEEKEKPSKNAFVRRHRDEQAPRSR